MAALADLCTQHRSTIFVGLMAAFQLTLSRLAGNVEDLVVGTPNAGRDDVLLQEMVGCIIEVLAIRGDLKGYPSFSTLLKRQQLVVTDALQHANSWVCRNGGIMADCGRLVYILCGYFSVLNSLYEKRFLPTTNTLPHNTRIPQIWSRK